MEVGREENSNENKLKRTDPPEADSFRRRRIARVLQGA